MKFIEIIVKIIIIVGLILIGYLGHDIVNSYLNQKQFEGLRFVINNSWKVALQTAQSYDNLGDWVCVNVRGMDYSRAVEVCNHEVGHEIFAEICEKNITKCLEVFNKWIP